MAKDMVRTGTGTYVLSTGVASASSGSWLNLGTAMTRFSVRCVRGTSVGTSNFSVSIRGSLSTHRTTGAAVGAIGAYTPSTVVAYTQAVVGKLKMSTALVPAQYVKYVVASMTTAANRKLRIELVAMP
jgi:hypothetical protein